MRILLISPSTSGKYSSVLLRNVQRALDQLGIAWLHIEPNEPVDAHPGFDLYLGTGDELLRRKPEIIRSIRAMGGISADFRTRFLPRQPKAWLKLIVERAKTDVDYVFTHFPGWHPRGLYVGQGVNDDVLYPDHDDRFTIYVDHWMRGRSARVQHLLDQCSELCRSRRGVRVWYHASDGIVENGFVEDRGAPIRVPFDQLAGYYRKTHVFLPTHRETQGIVAAEIAMCGGLTILAPWMYPRQSIRQIPHQFYRSRIHWPTTVDVAANRALARANVGIDAFSARLKAAIDKATRDGPHRH